MTEKTAASPLTGGEGGSHVSGILHHNTFHDICHMFAGICALFQIGIDFPPGHDGKYIPIGKSAQMPANMGQI